MINRIRCCQPTQQQPEIRWEVSGKIFFHQVIKCVALCHSEWRERLLCACVTVSLASRWDHDEAESYMLPGTLGLQTRNCMHQSRKKCLAWDIWPYFQDRLKASHRKWVNTGMSLRRSCPEKLFPFQQKLFRTKISMLIFLYPGRHSWNLRGHSFSVKFSHTEHHIIEILFRPLYTWGRILHNAWQCPDSSQQGSGPCLLWQKLISELSENKLQAKPFWLLIWKRITIKCVVLVLYKARGWQPSLKSKVSLSESVLFCWWSHLPT